MYGELKYNNKAYYWADMLAILSCSVLNCDSFVGGKLAFWGSGDLVRFLLDSCGTSTVTTSSIKPPLHGNKNPMLNALKYSHLTMLAKR